MPDVAGLMSGACLMKVAMFNEGSQTIEQCGDIYFHGKLFDMGAEICAKQQLLPHARRTMKRTLTGGSQ